VRIPIIDLRAQYVSIKPEIDAAVAEVFETQAFVGGPKVEAFERAIAGYLNIPHSVAVASGSDALLLILLAAGIGQNPGDEVITSTFSFFATAGAIANAGARPVFADIDPLTYNIDPEDIEHRITERTRAIMPVHLYGQCADMDRILDIARKHGLTVIEDAAQSFGAYYKGRRACTLGDAAGVSFYPTKNLGGAGDGGIIVTADTDIADHIRLLRAHGAGATYHHEIVGTNSRLDAIQAAVLLVKMKHFERWNERRRVNAAYYNEQFASVPEVATPHEAPENVHVFHQYVIRIPRRDHARKLLSSKGIGSAVFYPVPLHQQECFRHLGYEASDLPHADQACREVLALPVFPEMTQEQQDEVVNAIKEHCRA
jgi:dTDP-4-amino-4,6-dideoxygalactose transaminase